MTAAAPGHPAPGRIAALDSLRGIAAVGILLLHAFPAQAFWMWSFVDLFFVLSGFLISDILLRLDLRDVWQLRNFWMRRVLRIWPVYFLALAAAIAIWVARGVATDSWPGYNWGRCFVFLQFVEGYFTGPGSTLPGYPGWFRHSWTLAAEEQFYVLWPLALLLVAKRPVAIALLCVALVGGAILLRADGYPLVLMLTRSDGLAVGALLALMRWSGRAPWADGIARGRAYAVAAAVGAVLVLPYLVEGYAGGQVQGYSDLATFGNWAINVTGFALIYFALVGALADNRLPRVSRLLGWRPLVSLGLLSYAIYMFQGPVRGLLHGLNVGESQAHLVDYFAIPMTIAIAWVSRVTVEQWCERRKVHFPLHLRRPAPVPAPGAGE